PEGQRTDLQDVAVLQFALAGNLLLVDERAVGAVEVPHKGLVLAHQQGTVALADGGADRTEVALGIPADDKLGERHRNDFALGLTRRHDTQTQFHETTSFPSWEKMQGEVKRPPRLRGARGPDGDRHDGSTPARLSLGERDSALLPMASHESLWATPAADVVLHAARPLPDCPK